LRLEAALKYSQERTAFGNPICEFQTIQNYLAEMATRTDASRLLVYQAAWLKDQGLPYSKQAAMAKNYASESAVWCADRAVQIFGGYGYVKDYPVERFFRDSKITEIYEGTSEIQKVVIARNLIKETKG
jgi:alkylation response protein AidB-like acyl-CoA dehydrogenase